MLCVEVPVCDVGMSSEMPVSFSSSFFFLESAPFGRSGLIHTITSNSTLNNPVQTVQALFPLQISPLTLILKF